jgi:hypothetical protein
MTSSRSDVLRPDSLLHCSGRYDEIRGVTGWSYVNKMEVRPDVALSPRRSGRASSGDGLMAHPLLVRPSPGSPSLCYGAVGRFGKDVVGADSFNRLQAAAIQVCLTL